MKQVAFVYVPERNDSHWRKYWDNFSLAISPCVFFNNIDLPKIPHTYIKQVSDITLREVTPVIRYWTKGLGYFP